MFSRADMARTAAKRGVRLSSGHGSAGPSGSDFGLIRTANVRWRNGAREVFPAVLPLALALVPGLAFDAAGFRLGYGGGFYDTFLADFPGTTVGLCRTCQLSAVPLPRGPYDLPVGLVVTEDGDIIL